MAKPNTKLPEFTPQDLNRFWIKVRTGNPEECWLWTGRKKQFGYGMFRKGVSPAGKPRSYLVSRVAYFLATGQDPGELNVLHHCDNPPCCNANHLFLGTQQDNAKDCVSKGRANRARGDRHPSRAPNARWRQGESHGNAKLTDDQVKTIRLRAAAGCRPRTLADEYGMSTNNISRIVRRLAWKHI